MNDSSDLSDERLSAEEVVSTRRTQSPRLWEAFQPAGKIIHKDAWVELAVVEGWGMQELRTLIHGQIMMKKFDNLDREEQQARMNRYFDDAIEIIPAKEDSPRIPDLPWIDHALGSIIRSILVVAIAITVTAGIFAQQTDNPWLIGIVASVAAGGFIMLWILRYLMRRFIKDKIWPGLMEERLGDAIRRKFPNTDSKIRGVIDRYEDVFLDNNWMLVRLKRFFQSGAILLFYALAAAPVMVGLRMPAMILPLAAFAGLAAIFVIWLFFFLNKYIYTNMYSQSLRVSAQKVENLILERMTSINVLLVHTITHITQLMQQGERPQRDANKMDDNDLKEDYDTFFAMQTLMWLAKRLEYIELHLHNTLHTLLTVEGVMSIAGLVMTIAIGMLGVLPAAYMVFSAIETLRAGLETGQLSAADYPVIAQAAIAVITILFVIWISYVSYSNEKWNPMKTKSSEKSLLEDHFELKFGAQTYEKQELDVKLAARAQRAMFAIHSYFDRLGGRLAGGPN